MKKKLFLSVLLLTLLFSISIQAQFLRWNWWKQNPALSLIGFNNSLNPTRSGGAVAEGTFTPGLGFRSLTPTNLTSYKGILVSQSDNLQYTRGSLLGGDGTGVVYENFNPNQGTLEFWVRPNWNGNDGVTHYIFFIASSGNTNIIQFYKDSSGNLRSYFWASGVLREIAVSITSWTAGTWYHVVFVWDKNNTVDGTNYSAIYINNVKTGNANALGTPTAVGSVFYIGQLSNNVSQFNGVPAGRILNRPLTSGEVTALYASGAGHTDSFTVTPDTVAMFAYSDSDTDDVFWHRGQAVSATTATSATFASSGVAGLRSWTSGDRVAIWDGTGYKQETTLSATPASTDTSLALTSVAAIAKVGVGATLNGTTQYFNGGDVLDVGTNDISISAWVKAGTLSANHRIVYKNEANVSGYSLHVQSDGYLSGWIYNGTTYYQVTANSNAINDSKWHHIVFVVDRDSATGLKFFVDGYETTYSTQNDPTPITATDLQNAGSFNIGGTSGQVMFPGSIRDVRIYIAAGANWSAANILTQATNPLNNAVGGTNTSNWYLTDAATQTSPQDSTGTNHLTLVGGTTTNYGTHSRTQTAFISKNLLQDGRMGNGGIGGWTAGDAQSTLAKGTTVIKFDERVLRITNADASQAFARQTITTTAGEDYYFHGWFNSPATPNGASQLVDVDAAAALGVTVTQAGATTAATWYEVQSCFEAADTSTTIDLGSGSVTNAQIGRWDNVKVHKNLVNNGGMEGGASPPAGWTQETDATVISDTTPRSGTNHLKATAGAANVGVKQSVTLVSGKYYTILGWVKATSDDSGQIIIDTGDTTLLTVGMVTVTSYTKVQATFKATGTAGVVYLRAVANTDIVWFDDVAIIRLDQDDPSTTGTTTPSTSGNSFGTGKWSDSSGAFQSDGLDTLTYPNTNISTDRGTIAFWAKISSPYNAAENKILFDARGADDNNRVKIFYQASDDKFTVFLNGANRIQSVAQVNNNNFYTWHHFVFAYDFVIDRYTFFIDGILIGTNTTALPPFSLGANSIYIGSNYDASGQADAFFDDMFFFKKELTQNDIRRLYALPRSAHFRSLMGGW